MPKAEKTSEAVYRSVRINPRTSQEDADMLKVIEEAERDGWTFKQIVQHAILNTAGKTPEMYSKGTGGFILSSIETMLTRFANELLNSGRRSAPIRVSDDEEEEIAPFAKQLAKSFLERQRANNDE